MNLLLKSEMAAQSDVLEAMHENAEKNAATSGGLFLVYPINYDGDLDQTIGPMGNKTIKGDPIDKQTMFKLAQKINPAYVGLEKKLTSEDNLPAIEDTATTARTGASYAITTDHQELQGIAVLGGGVGAIHREHIPNYRNGLVLNKSLLSFMGISPDIVEFLDDVIGDEREKRGIELEEDGSLKLQNFLKLVFDYQYPVIPNSDSFSTIRGVQGRLIKRYNDVVVSDIESNMTNSSFLRRRRRNGSGLFVALAGAKNKPLDVDEWRSSLNINSYSTTPEPHEIPDFVSEIDVMGRISNRVIDYLRYSRVYGATAGFKDNAKQDFDISISAKVHAILEESDLDHLAGHICRVATDTFGRQVIYDKKGNLPLATFTP